MKLLQEKGGGDVDMIDEKSRSRVPGCDVETNRYQVRGSESENAQLSTNALAALGFLVLSASSRGCLYQWV